MEQTGTTAKPKILEESMMIATTSVDGTTRDTTKTAEPPPSINTTSLKQPHSGYVVAELQSTVYGKKLCYGWTSMLRTGTLLYHGAGSS